MTPGSSVASNVAVGAAALGSRITADMLATCVQHIKDLLGSIETIQQALLRQEHGIDHTEHHENLIASYFQARETLDNAFLGRSLDQTQNHVDVQAASRITDEESLRNVCGSPRLGTRTRASQRERIDSINSSGEIGARLTSRERELRCRAAPDLYQRSRYRRRSTVVINPSHATEDMMLIEFDDRADSRDEVMVGIQDNRMIFGCFPTGAIKRGPTKRGPKRVCSSRGSHFDPAEGNQRKASESDEEVDVLLREWITLV